MDALFAWLRSLFHSRLLRLVLVGILASLLLIPIAAIDSLVSERAGKRDEAHAEVADKWGGPQSVRGPALVVPYTRRSSVKKPDGSINEVAHTFHARILPDVVTLDTELDSELRHRGLYEIPLYTARTRISGEFSKPSLSEWDIPESDVHWERARLVVEIAQSRALRKQVQLQWGGQKLAFEPGTLDRSGAPPGIHAPIRVSSTSTEFSFELAYSGSRELRFSPVARTSNIAVRADWPHPSFQGQWLPTTSSIDGQGFSASWTVPHLGRSYPQLSRDEGADLPALQMAELGVDLVSPVDTYKMSARSVKYAGLLLLLTFLVVWVLEVLGDFRIHSIQYLLTGAAVCVFFLLQLSLAEHLGFFTAHFIASSLVVALVTAYGWVTLGNRWRAFVLGGVLAALYSYLFVLFQLETIALLIGALATFAALATVMFVTRRVRW